MHRSSTPEEAPPREAPADERLLEEYEAERPGRKLHGPPARS